jgi:hypothetical protein
MEASFGKPTQQVSLTSLLTPHKAAHGTPVHTQGHWIFLMPLMQHMAGGPPGGMQHCPMTLMEHGAPTPQLVMLVQLKVVGQGGTWTSVGAI